jgi:glutaconyl-CoA/methylmalonyl-CoA decarboxylase subunit gamma
MKLNVKIDGQVFEVEVRDLQARPIQVWVDGEAMEVWLEENGSVQVKPTIQANPSPVVSAPQAAAAPAASAAQATAASKAVLAPIPGVIVSITVKEGDSVVFGQELCILEAMKMKNLIKANRAGKIAAIRVSAGDQVRHHQVLMDYTD